MKREHDIVALLMGSIGSPEVVGEIKRALIENAQEREELLELEKMALRRHGDKPSSNPESQPHEGEAQGGFRLTVGELIERYRSDAESGFQQLRFRTRENYTSLLKRLERDIGGDKIADFDQERLESLFDEWSGGGERIPIARSLIAMLRILAAYGVTALKSRDCRELKLTLHDIRFEMPTRSRSERLTRDQAKAIIAKAHEDGLHSMALAQAFQIDCNLKQKDAIGEWAPMDEPGDRYLVDEETNTKWLHGLRWENISRDWILNLVTSFGGELLTIDLKNAPLVMDELSAMRVRAGKAEFPDHGPVIVHEKTGLPYLTHTFRCEWRKLADALGIPKHVKNMDAGVAGE
jgi:hypothetical protein